MALPTTAFAPANTIIPRKSFITFISDDPTPVTTSLVGKVSNFDRKHTTVSRKVPDSNGYLRPDRIELIEVEEALMFETEDVKAVAAVFGNNLAGGFKTGTCQLWVVDPDDAATKCAVKSNAFACTIENDGGLNLKAGEVSLYKLKIVALATVTLTVDATA